MVTWAGGHGGLGALAILVPVPLAAWMFSQVPPDTTALADAVQNLSSVDAGGLGTMSTVVVPPSVVPPDVGRLLISVAESVGAVLKMVPVVGAE